MRHALLIGVVERIARSSEREAFVLRGGLLTRTWIAPRPRATKDLDFVGDFPFDRDDTARRFAAALATPVADELVVDTARMRAASMWVESGFPGVKITLPIGLGAPDQTIDVDIGFNDPLVPPAEELAFPTFSTRAVRPETQLAWKLHGLVEMGVSWRPKDLADLDLITEHVPLDRAVLPAAIDAAFTSRGYAVELASSIFTAEHWATKTARLRWEPYEQRHGSLATTVAKVAHRLAESTRS